MQDSDLLVSQCASALYLHAAYVGWSANTVLTEKFEEGWVAFDDQRHDAFGLGYVDADQSWKCLISKEDLADAVSNEADLSPDQAAELVQRLFDLMEESSNSTGKIVCLLVLAHVAYNHRITVVTDKGRKIVVAVRVDSDLPTPGLRELGGAIDRLRYGPLSLNPFGVVEELLKRSPFQISLQDSRIVVSDDASDLMIDFADDSSIVDLVLSSRDVAVSDDQDLFAMIPIALSTLKWLPQGRSDIAWRQIRTVIEDGNGEALARAFATVMSDWVTHFAKGQNTSLDKVLNKTLAGWNKYSDLGSGLNAVDLERLEELTLQTCTCGHAAYDHRASKWIDREFGFQTDKPCDIESCECQIFEEASSAAAVENSAKEPTPADIEPTKADESTESTESTEPTNTDESTESELIVDSTKSVASVDEAEIVNDATPSHDESFDPSMSVLMKHTYGQASKDKQQAGEFVQLVCGNDLLTLNYNTPSDVLAGGVASGAQPQTSDDETQLLITKIETRQGLAVPLWPSLPDLENGLALLELGDTGYVGMGGRAMLEMLAGSLVVLNPRTENEIILSENAVVNIVRMYDKG